MLGQQRVYMTERHAMLFKESNQGKKQRKARKKASESKEARAEAREVSKGVGTSIRTSAAPATYNPIKIKRWFSLAGLNGHLLSLKVRETVEVPRLRWFQGLMPQPPSHELLCSALQHVGVGVGDCFSLFEWTKCHENPLSRIRSAPGAIVHSSTGGREDDGGDGNANCNPHICRSPRRR